MKRGFKKYACDECKAESNHHWIERNRAARLRCPACGSARMELVTVEAQNEAALAQRVRVEGHRDLTNKLIGHDTRKKVV